MNMSLAVRALARSAIAAGIAILAIAATSALAQPKQATARPPAKAAAFDPSACLACHAPIKAFYDGGKHKTVGCNACHDGTAAHLADASKRPATKTDLATCGGCHQNQYKSYAQMDFHRTARFEKKQMTGPAPDPAYDLLMTPHGFTKEHNLPRGHTFALLDQYVVDRAFGGRFTPKDRWRYLAGSGDFKVWDVLIDLYPDNSDQKSFKPGTAAAANPVCLSCKTQDHILEWAYMGDPVPGAKWSRTSKVVEAARAVNHSLNCIFCHDPHAAKPRIVRDALIEAVTRTDAPTLYSQDPRKTKVDVKDMGVRGFTRKIGMLERYDGRLQCGQCHVEYNCNPGFNPNTGEPITMADKRTNYFPFVDVNSILKAYDGIQFRDFRNQFTGAALWKA
ncbi:MAG: ammonia-forming cytochrome c nitrite reductase subunit c552, partial [Betaproteobacteria bacterium]